MGAGLPHVTSERASSGRSRTDTRSARASGGSVGEPGLDLDLAGAELFVASGDTDPAAALKAWDGGADVILNAAPSNQAASDVLGGLAPGRHARTLRLRRHPAHTRRLADGAQPAAGMASPSGSPHDLRDTLAFSAQHRILPTITPITLDEAPATLEAMGSGSGGGRRVISFE